MLALIAIGIVEAIKENLFAFLLPVIILGGIFLLYKYPPSFLGGGRPANNRKRNERIYQTAKPKQKHQRPRSKTVPFKVIEGGKDDDDLPKYH